MELPKTYNPKKVEKRIYKKWEESGFFNPDNCPGKKEGFCITIPPPNVTGKLHMGHALNAVIQDVLIRKKRMEGYKTLWLPGTDHAGIATQNVVEKKLKKEGKTRFDLGRKKFIKEVWKWKEKYGNIILKQLKKLGSSCDWSRTRFTMDEDYSKAVKQAFVHYFKKGLIRRGKRVVNWCPRCATSLSNLELEHEEKKGKLWHIHYPFKNKVGHITVATTRPETMLGDTAVAVNPKDKRYKDIIGEKVILPLVEREIPIIKDILVDPEFGTGAVKVTPAHDFTDYKIGKKHNLEIIQVIDKEGKITKKAPKKYQNLEVEKAREKIIKDLKKKELLEKTESHIHKIPKCYRCGTTIEFIPSWQWFLKMDKLAETAKNPVKKGEIKFHPSNFKKLYFNWLEKVRDWCISRQIWWGHRMPIWECQNAKKTAKMKKRFFASIKNPKECKICGKCEPKQVTDVLDTWFSSALWPFATLGWPKETKDLKKFYPTNVLSTARDIINLWVTRMIFSGEEFMKKIPFSDVIIHATILTQEGKRMSKSLGTGIDPIKLIEKYGADATRFGIAYQIMGGQDIRFVEDNITMGEKFCNKIWNATRFLLENIEKSNSKFKNLNQVSGFKILTEADRKVIKKLNKTINQVDKDLERFEFGQAAHKLYDFFWHDFCDNYIEQSKPQLKNEEQRKNTEKILLYVSVISLKLLHPFCPFITEELYQKLPIEEKKLLLVEKWPQSIEK